jgi:tRNA A37 N6-isopentenylltransferase MiaA
LDTSRTLTDEAIVTAARKRSASPTQTIDPRLRRLPRPLSSTAREAIGYREAFAVLDGDLPVDDLASEIATRTWRYAKRQRAWFRKDPRVVWSDPDEVLAAWT